MYWESLFNHRALRLQPSIIQEMMAFASRPGVISFAAGQPSEDLYPTEAIAEGLKFSLSEPFILAYPNTAGDTSLREWISVWMAKEGLSSGEKGGKNILLTTGSQQGLNILSQLFLQEGDGVIVENPSYPEAMLTFAKEGARFFPVSLDEEGPIPEELETLLSQEKIRFFYTIPTFQNPSGRSTSAARKKIILEVLKRHNVFVVEDDPYRQLWFDEEPACTYLSMAEKENHVVYLGSFSKIIAPGLRCGWMVLPPEVMEKAVYLRLTLELGVSALLQKTVLYVVSQEKFLHHMRRIRAVYAQRRHAMASAVEEYLNPLGFKSVVPKGGFFFWGELHGVNGVDLSYLAAAKHKVAVIPGEIFFSKPEEGRFWMRLSFAKVGEEKIIDGVKRLSCAIQEFI